MYLDTVRKIVNKASPRRMTRKISLSRMAKRYAATVGVIGVWSLFNQTTPDPSTSSIYPLPEEIRVEETTLPFEEREGESSLEKFVRTEDIDFSEKFIIKTDRYKLEHNEDFLISQLVGHVMSTFGKLMLWDKDIGAGLEEERSAAVLSMLENNEDIKDITVRINHNSAIEDFFSLYSDERKIKRNNVIARTVIGLSTCIGNTLWAELFRGDYYNPITQTAVLYSDLESIAAHEIGHHMDFQRFSSDWEYGLAGIFPPVTLYKEWQASTNARDELLAEDQKDQFNRFLLPAFFSYLVAGYYASRQILKKVKLSKQGIKSDDVSKYVIDISPLETLRHFATQNAKLYSGIIGYTAMKSSENPNEFLNIAGFTGLFLGAHHITGKIGKKIIPYKDIDY